MYNTNDENEKDEGLNLSDMINEYEEDSVLRNKIEALKAEKAKEEAQRFATQEIQVEETSEQKNLSNTMELPRYGSSSVVDGTFLDADDIQDIDSDEELDADKTLVIMDNPAKREFDDNESILYYGDHEVDAEEITEEDIQEFLGDEEVKKQRKPMDPKKMNKIITYVISAVVGVCVLVGGGFGVKILMDSFQSEDTSEPAEKDKPKVEDPVEKPKTDTPVDDPKDNGNTNQGNNNAVKIAEINGSIKAKQQQVSELNTAVENAKSEITRLEAEAIKLKDDYRAKDDQYIFLNTEMNNAKNNLDKEKNDFDAGTGSSERVEKATKDLEKIIRDLEPLATARNEAKAAYDKKIEDKGKKENEKDGYVSQISSIQLEIDNLQKELQTLQ